MSHSATNGFPAAHFEVVSPEQAAEWLEKRAENRRVQDKLVDKYARDMVEDRWDENGETIKLDEGGVMFDGQHRAMAIVRAGRAVRMLVVRGIPRSAAASVDLGRSRSFSDVLAMHGQANCVVLAAAVNLVARYETIGLRSNAPRTHKELEDTLARHPGLVDSVKLVTGGQQLAPPAPLAFVHYYAARTAPRKAREFVYILQNGSSSDGTGVPASNATFLMRERLIANRGSKQRLPRNEIIALMIKAWNHFAAGRPLKTLRWRTRGETAESFPDFDLAAGD